MVDPEERVERKEEEGLREEQGHSKQVKRLFCIMILLLTSKTQKTLPLSRRGKIENRKL